MFFQTVAQRGQKFSGSAFSDPIYRIPALTTTASGRIILAYDVRSDWRDLPADFDIAYRYSDDGGRTWSEAAALRRHSTGHGFGDASLLTDPGTGNVLCWYVGSTGESYFSAKAGGAGLELWLAVSSDDGLTWQHHDHSDLRPANVAGMFTSSGTGAALGDGTLLQTFVARIDEQNYAICGRSTDQGATWVLGEPVGPDCDENKVVELDDGAVLLHARAMPQRRQAISRDHGQTFTTPVPVQELRDPACNGGLVRCGSILVASMCDDARYRRRLSLHISSDDGATWSAPILIDDGASAYSALTLVDASTVGIAWEADDYQSIVFGTVGINELVEHVNGGAALKARQGRAGWAKPPVVNS
ncbi:sialidase-1 [Arcanobacterium pluranimalium]|uniref:exo-alpha-sialidase n=1 Tax=Arcanobacterium pluranimalium TaxID=108028 RepID=UPI00195F0183|nr:sialidase-1 [Arcanobacterium pluranimalium]